MEKLSRVLGAARAQQLYAETLALLRLPELRTADDLHAFGEVLARKGGFEAAVGSMLCVAAVLRGAASPGARP